MTDRKYLYECKALARLLSHESRMTESEDTKLRRIYGRKREAVTGGYSKMVKTNYIIRRYNSRVRFTWHETSGISSTNERDEKCVQNFYRTI